VICAGIWLIVAANLHAATLELEDATSVTDISANLPIRLSGSPTVVAMQFDLSFPASRVAVNPPALKALVAQHRVSFRELHAGLTRVVVFSTANVALPQDLILDLPIVSQAQTKPEDLVLTISNIWFADAAGKMIQASPGYGPVTKWKRLTFTLAELLNPAISGDASDPDYDGVPNLVEMLLRGRAKTADPARVPVLGAQLNPQDSRWYLTLTYHQSKTAQGIAGEVQESTDLKTWPVVVPSVATGVQDATTIEMRASVLMEGERQFLRLGAKRTGSP
jgi:hypothetical protein